MSLAIRDRAATVSAWTLYTLIVLEILFMVSPFAAYYYSVYATPLNAMQQSSATAWLTMYVLPHFTYSGCWFANALVLIAWPLILLGSVLFVLGFCQVYWAKFTRQGAVEVGLYRYIRHPQYLALAVIGLGTTLYWSRFIVIIAFASMLCIYYFLARIEEKTCTDRFGASYVDYVGRTGMFLPRRWEAWFRGIGFRLPSNGWRRVAAGAGLYAGVLTLAIGSAVVLRSHVIGSLQVETGDQRTAVFLAPVPADIREAVGALLNQPDLPGSLAYVAPSSWHVPELGFTGKAQNNETGNMAELLHPGTHGNSLQFNQQRLSVLLAESVIAGKKPQGLARFSRALGIQALAFAELDLAAGEIIHRRPASQGPWAGIPVPTF